MGRICVHEFVSLDGVFEDPSWTAPYGFPEAMGQAIAAFTGASSAILLGRVTFDVFAPAWSTRTAEDDPGAPFFNETRKYVVSGSRTAVDEWANSTVFGPYNADALRRLKDELPGNVYVSGSGTLVRAMLADRLIDELHLFVYPVALGAGRRLLDGVGAVPLALLEHEVYDNGVVHLAYGPAVT